jgi:hypothetical protein
MDGTFLLPLLILAFVLAFIWQFLATKKALATTRLESRRPPHEAAQLVQNAFSGARNALWTGANGPGTINMRRRGKDGGIIMSIQVVELPGGGSAVDMWASTYHEYLGVLANMAGSVNSRKKAIARLLDA